MIEATRTDPRFADHAATAAFPNIGSYLGVPIIRSDGAFFGTLCAVDPEPRPFSREQVDLMVVLARLVATQLERDRELAVRDQVESELRRSEARFATPFRASPVAIVVRSLVDGRFRDVNDRFLEMTGYTREEVIGRTPSEVGVWAGSPEEDRTRVAGLVGAHGGVRNHVGTLCTKTGELRHVLLSMERIELEGEPCLLAFGYDVTERNRMEEELRQNEERFRALVANAYDIITILDEDGIVRYETSSLERVLGYAPEEFIGLAPFDLVHPDDERAAVRLFEEVLRNPGVSIPADFRFRHKEGSWRWMQVIGTNMLADPAVSGIVLNSRDVTERKQSEVALKASEEEARQLAAATARQARELELLHQVRSALARELELPVLFQTVVEAIAAAFGYSMVSLYLIEDGLLRLQHQVGYHQVLDRIPLEHGVSGRVARTGQPALLYDGATDPDFLAAFAGISSEVCVPLHDDGRVVGILNLETTGGERLGEPDLRLMLALGEHVSVAIGRARLYTEARESERRFRSLVQNAFDVITILSAAGTIWYESPSIERVLGYTPEELLGRDAFAFVHPDDAAEVRDRFLANREVPGNHELVTFRFQHKNGSWRWLEGIGTNLLDDPSIGGFVFNSRDVTERKRLAEEAARAEALAHSDRLKSALLATVSHELRTPLATIKTGVSSLLSPEARWTTTEQEEFLREIDVEVDRLTLMVGNLLDLSRIEGGALRPHLDRHDLGEFVADVVQRLSHRTTDRLLAVKVEPNLPPVPCDAVQIAQVILNLGDNAIRYTPPGTPITFSIRRQSDAVEVTVADRGPGIPASEVDRIFEKFYRVSAHTTSPGAGLGLAICTGLVEAHGGRIWAESREGEGTAVHFTLPLYPDHEERRES